MNDHHPQVLWDHELPSIQEPTSWLWHGLLARGNLTLLTAVSKSGKTTLLSLLLARRHQGGTLAGLAVQPGKTDRYPFFSFLIQKALKDGAHDAALDHVNEAERIDCAHNEGKRRNDYELRRAQVHAGRGEIDAAQDVYQRLIERTPTNFRVRGQAAETMLALKQSDRALMFAEDGLAAARQANDRDSEHYLTELAEAAKRQRG